MLKWQVRNTGNSPHYLLLHVGSLSGKGTILITSDVEERDEAMLEKPLSEFVSDGAILSCDDFLQNYNLKVEQRL